MKGEQTSGTSCRLWESFPKYPQLVLECKVVFGGVDPLPSQTTGPLITAHSMTQLLSVDLLAEQHRQHKPQNRLASGYRSISYKHGSEIQR